jgi:2-methylcitrate dehydratase PrpD
MLAGAATEQARSLGKTLLQPAKDDPAANAYAYALSGRLLDYDDVQTTHNSTFGLLANPTVPVLAAALAVGQAKKVSGEAFLNAYLIGVEIAARLAAGTPPAILANRLAATTVFGGVGALIAAAKLLGLDRKAVREAYELWQLLVPPEPLHYDSRINAAHRDGHSVRMAVQAALQAQHGIGTEPIFHGPLSMVSPATIASLSRRLGNPYCILEPGFAIRTYASNPLMHPAIDATLAIVNVHGIDPADIERIDVGMTRIMADRLCTVAPKNNADLGRNVPYAIALAVCKGVLEPADFLTLSSDQATLAMAGRVHRVVDPSLDDLGYERARSWVRVTLRSGRGIALKMEVAKGTPQKPLSETELSHKFFQCALQSTDERYAEQLLNRLWALETIGDMAQLFNAGTSASSEAEPRVEAPRRRRGTAMRQSTAA